VAWTDGGGRSESASLKIERVIDCVKRSQSAASTVLLMGVLVIGHY
jgi:hypothetical protein